MIINDRGRFGIRRSKPGEDVVLVDEKGIFGLFRGDQARDRVGRFAHTNSRAPKPAPKPRKPGAQGTPFSDDEAALASRKLNMKPAVRDKINRDLEAHYGKSKNLSGVESSLKSQGWKKGGSVTDTEGGGKEYDVYTHKDFPGHGISVQSRVSVNDWHKGKPADARGQWSLHTSDGELIANGQTDSQLSGYLKRNARRRQSEARAAGDRFSPETREPVLKELRRNKALGDQVNAESERAYGKSKTLSQVNKRLKEGGWESTGDQTLANGRVITEYKHRKQAGPKVIVQKRVHFDDWEDGQHSDARGSWELRGTPGVGAPVKRRSGRDAAGLHDALTGVEPQ